jgi:preprotein translocase subunit SecY
MTDRGERIFSIILLLLASGFIFWYSRQAGLKYEDDPLFALLSLALAVGGLLMIWMMKPRKRE